MNKEDRKLIVIQLIRLRDVKDDLDVLRDSLQERLDSVEEHFPDGPLAEQLQEQLDEIESCVDDTDNLIDRLEEMS